MSKQKNIQLYAMSIIFIISHYTIISPILFTTEILRKNNKNSSDTILFFGDIHIEQLSIKNHEIKEYEKTAQVLTKNKHIALHDNKKKLVIFLNTILSCIFKNPHHINEKNVAQEIKKQKKLLIEFTKKNSATMFIEDPKNNYEFTQDVSLLNNAEHYFSHHNIPTINIENRLIDSSSTPKTQKTQLIKASMLLLQKIKNAHNAVTTKKLIDFFKKATTVHSSFLIETNALHHILQPSNKKNSLKIILCGASHVPPIVQELINNHNYKKYNHDLYTKKKYKNIHPFRDYTKTYFSKKDTKKRAQLYFNIESITSNIHTELILDNTLNELYPYKPK